MGLCLCVKTHFLRISSVTCGKTKFILILGLDLSALCSYVLSFEILIILKMGYLIFVFPNRLWALWDPGLSLSCPLPYSYQHVPHETLLGISKREFKTGNWLHRRWEEVRSWMGWWNNQTGVTAGSSCHHQGPKDTGKGWCHKNQRLRLSHGWGCQWCWMEGLSSGKLEPHRNMMPKTEREGWGK